MRVTAGLVIIIDTARITDWKTFHAVFAEICGFPDFYGHNLNAWIDCMSSLDDPGAGMTSVHCDVGAVAALQLLHVDSFARRCPDQYAALVDCAAFVNWRRIEQGQSAVLALSFDRSR
jgi:hypothetical protein